MGNQTPDEGVCPERPSGVEGSLSFPIRKSVLPAPTLSGRSIATKDLSAFPIKIPLPPAPSLSGIRSCFLTSLLPSPLSPELPEVANHLSLSTGCRPPFRMLRFGVP